MKKILTLALAFAMLQFTASAQTERVDAKAGKGQKPGMHKGKGLENVEGLNLSEAQKNQIAVLKTDSKTKMKAIKASSVSEEDKKKQMQEIRKSGKTRMESILTADQKKLLKEKKATAKKEGKMDGKRTGKKMDGDKREQAKEKFANMSPETKAKLKAIKDDQSLTQEQKKAAARKIFMENREQGARMTPTKS